MKRQFLVNARARITGTNEGLHIRDPRGDELYLKFLAHVLPAYAAGLKGGKSAAELLDPDSKDYVGRGMDQFVRPMSVWVQDMLTGNDLPGQAPAQPPGAAAQPAAPTGPMPLPSADEPTRNWIAPKAEMKPGAQAAPDLSSRDAIARAYSAGQLSWDQAAQELQKRGFVRTPAAAPLVPVH